MANIKISALPAAAALTGTEAVPVVQSGVTVKTTAAAIAATGTTPTLNLVTTAGNSTTPSIVFKASGSGSTAYVSNSTGNWLSLNGVAEVVPAGGIAPVTTTTYALGTTSFRWAKLWSYDADLSGALAVSGNVTPALLTASKPVFTDASKNLVSTGTLAYDQGGTGQTTYAAGDIVYASATNTLTKLPVGTNGQVLKVTAGLLPAWGTDSAGTGDVVGPASSTDNAIARFDTTTGKLIQNSAVTIADTTGDIVGTATQGVFNTVSTTVNAFGAATTLNVGAATGTMTVANTTLAAKAITASTTLNVTGVATLGNGAVLGTPTSMTATNITGTATAFTASNVTTNANLTGGVTSVGNAATVVTNANLTGAVTSVGNATSLGSFSSANLLGALTDETGTGSAVFATSPTLVTPLLGTPASGVVTNLTGTASININGTVGATTPTTVVATTVKASTTMGVGAATPSASGAGITFPATQDASTDANTLDDYEEGTWTPSVGGTATYTAQDGIYTKIGRLVSVTFVMNMNLRGTGSTTTITGLPFAQISAANRSGGAVAYYQGLAVNVLSVIPVIDGAVSSIFFSGSTTASATITDSLAIIGNNANIYSSITYTA